MDVNKVRCDKQRLASDEFAGVAFDVEFLEKVAYEWIRRMAFYSDFSLSDSIIQSMATQFKLVLNMHWFYPTKGWVDKFRSTYDLPEVDTQILSIAYKVGRSVQIRAIVRELLCITESNRISKLKAKETEIEHKVDKDCEIVDIEDELPKSLCTAYGSTTVEKNLEKDSTIVTMLGDIEDFLPTSVCTPSSKTTVAEDQEQRELPKMQKKSVQRDSHIVTRSKAEPQSSPVPKVSKRQMTTSPTETIAGLKKHLPQGVKCSKIVSSKPATLVGKTKNSTKPVAIAKKTRFSQLGPLKTREDALKYIKQIEEFAMIKENFRLIGFIDRLEKMIRSGE